MNVLTSLTKATEKVKEEPQTIEILDWPKYLDFCKHEFLESMSKKGSKNVAVNFDDFKFTKTLGQGGFGKVMLVERKATRIKYAAKLQEKEFIVKNNQVKSIKNEKKLLEALKFPFTINLDFFFQDNVYLYFIMPLMEAGDVYSLLQRKGRFDEHLARFYAAQVLLALEYMHYIDLLYRDIKPENILLDREGYVRVVDYGLSKIVKDRTYTFCGTPDYIAPEIIENRGYGKSVDYWSFGVLLYEFNSGRTPFSAEDPTELYEKIVSGQYSFVSHFSNELKDIISHLVQNDLTMRYGNLKGGINDIKEHLWFKKILWLALVNKSVKPPFVPHKVFTGYAESRAIEKRSSDPYHDLFTDF